jgi:hypothetical protein
VTRALALARPLLPGPVPRALPSIKARSRRLSRPLRLAELALAWPRPARTTRPLTVSIVEAAAVLAQREVGRLPFRHLAFLPWKRRAYERPVHPVVLRTAIVLDRVVGRDRVGQGVVGGRRLWRGVDRRRRFE